MLKPSDEVRAISELAEGDDLLYWWLDTALRDYRATVGKIKEYGGHSGSGDIELMAEGMRIMNPNIAAADDPRVALEAAVSFYLLGKVARAQASYAHGKLPSEDTLLDQTVYPMMARSIRETGNWG